MRKRNKLYLSPENLPRKQFPNICIR